MADNNDDQYLDELLNSLRSSNSDGNEDLDNQDSESNKSRQSDAEDNEAAEDGSNEEQDDFLNGCLEVPRIVPPRFKIPEKSSGVIRSAIS